MAGPGLLEAVHPTECRDGTPTAVESGFSKNIRIIWQGSIPDVSIAPFKKNAVQSRRISGPLPAGFAGMHGSVRGNGYAWLHCVP